LYIIIYFKLLTYIWVCGILQLGVLYCFHPSSVRLLLSISLECFAFNKMEFCSFAFFTLLVTGGGNERCVLPQIWFCWKIK
jgi:hypothetical protein